MLKKQSHVRKLANAALLEVEKGKTEKHEEQVQYAAYKQFSEDTKVEKTNAIKEAEEMMEMLKAVHGGVLSSVEDYPPKNGNAGENRDKDFKNISVLCRRGGAGGPKNG